MLLYAARCAALGGQSLPNAHTNGLACARSARIWLASDAFATCSCSADQRPSFSQALQQTKPGMIITPARSARSQSSSFPSVPSSRIVFRPMFFTYWMCVAFVFVSQRCSRSHM